MARPRHLTSSDRLSHAPCLVCILRTELLFEGCGGVFQWAYLSIPQGSGMLRRRAFEAGAFARRSIPSLVYPCAETLLGERKTYTLRARGDNSLLLLKCCFQAVRGLGSVENPMKQDFFSVINLFCLPEGDSIVAYTKNFSWYSLKTAGRGCLKKRYT